MTARTDKRKQFLTDVLTTAVEGGINYWADVHEYKHDVPLGDAYAVVQDSDDDTEPKHRVTIDTIAKGIASQIKANKDRPKGAYWWSFVLANRTNGDDGDFDASIADAILQAGIFDGEVVYG
jgi:hypothetical protein